MVCKWCIHFLILCDNFIYFLSVPFGLILSCMGFRLFFSNIPGLIRSTRKIRDINILWLYGTHSLMAELVKLILIFKHLLMNLVIMVSNWINYSQLVMWRCGKAKVLLLVLLHCHWPWIQSYMSGTMPKWAGVAGAHFEIISVFCQAWRNRVN